MMPFSTRVVAYLPGCGEKYMFGLVGEAARMCKTEAVTLVRRCKNRACQAESLSCGIRVGSNDYCANSA